MIQQFIIVPITVSVIAVRHTGMYIKWFHLLSTNDAATVVSITIMQIAVKLHDVDIAWRAKTYTIIQL